MGQRYAYLLCLAAAFAASSPAGAEIQNPASAFPDPTDVEARDTQSRAQRESSTEPYAPLGLRAGVFDFRPSLEISAIASDNPGQLSTGGQPAAGLRLTPEIELKSDWVRHMFYLKAAGERIDYADQPELATMEGEIEGAVTLDLRRNTTAELVLAAAQSQSASSSSEVPDNAATKRNDYEFGLSASVNRNAGRLEGRLRTDLSRFIYDDVELTNGGNEDNSDRNYLEASTALRVMQGTSAGLRPFAEVVIAPRLHDEKTDRNGLRRDSLGVAVKAGAEIAAGILWSGTAGLQYDFRKFADDEFEDFSGVGAFAELVWRPSRLTTASLLVESGFEESASAGVSGHRTQDAEITIAHALKDNLTFSVSAAAGYSAAQGSDSRSLTVEAGGEVIYALTRALSLVASYEHTRFMSFGEGSDYEETEVTAGVKISR